MRLAYTLIDPRLFPAPAWMLREDELDLKVVVDHARVLAGVHREYVKELESGEEKPTYFGGVLDAQRMIDAEMG